MVGIVVGREVGRHGMQDVVVTLYSDAKIDQHRDVLPEWWREWWELWW